MRVLCLDIEGGYGGSSRSLFESIRHLPPEATVEVWCRQQGPVRERYEMLGVTCRVSPDMPHFSSLPRLSRNLYVFSRFLMSWRRSGRFRAQLAEAAKHFDLVHFNHEGLFLLACWLRRRAGASMPLTMHIRTHLPSALFSRWQYRRAVDACDRFVYITENEQRRVAQLVGRSAPGTVIYNIVAPPAVQPRADLIADPRFKVVAVSNYAFIRGIDRLIDVAAALKARGRTDVLFVIAGRMTLPRSLSGELGQVARAGGDLADFARESDVAEMFKFLGHVSEPENVILACDLLAKPTREYNPWGRDILEAMAFGKPAISVGTYDRFVENGVTGILHAEFDAEQWADEIVRLADDRAQLAALGRAAQERVLKLSDGPSRARDLRDFWAGIIAANAKKPCVA